MGTQPLDRPGDPGGSLASGQVDAMVAAWHRGDRTRAEDVLEAYPGLGEDAAIRLIFEEFCLREEAGEPVGPEEIGRRFPRWRDELVLLLQCRRMMEPNAAAAGPARVGEDLAGFRLLAELGRGASGGVFLASESELADRPVVLKVTARGREEHLSLARLQHMNIVPLFSARILPERDLQVLCMPFLGGGSLAQVLDSLGDRPPARRTGGDLVEALDRIHARLPVPLPNRGPLHRDLAGSSYVEAVCWIGASLADGLQYAHERDLVHMDVKPSNVLLAGDAQPMLLDFHLARGPIRPGGPTPAWLGGTPAYMAPEQREALAAVSRGRPIRAEVDGRADIFSLGRLLVEALGGPGGIDAPARALPRLNPRVSTGLSDILGRCLEPDPRDRYPDAASVAADLRRHLSNEPLLGVRNRSPAERWRKWRRRRPLALSRGLVALGLVVASIASAALASVAYIHRVNEVEAALADSRALLGRGEFDRATAALKRCQELAAGLPIVGPYRVELAGKIAEARRLGKAAELRQLVELVRFRYGLDPPPPDAAESLIRRGRAVWEARHFLLGPVGSRDQPEAEGGVRGDLLDFALFWADLHVRSASVGRADQARREALAILDQVDELLGPSPAAERDRRAFSGSPPGPASQPRTAWEHYELGRSFLRSGEVEAAARQFRLGLGLRPQDYWLNFFEGLAAYRLGRFGEAVNAFRVCIALSPETAESFYNRAMARAALGQVDRALADYTRALDRKPGLAVAALNRGILRFQAGQLDRATADLRLALDSTTDPVVVGDIRFNMALIDLARGDRPAALAHLDAAVAAGSSEARSYRDSLRP